MNDYACARHPHDHHRNRCDRRAAEPASDEPSRQLGDPDRGEHFDGRQGYVGGKWVEITYGRPITRGRDLFGPDEFVEFLNDGAPVGRPARTSRPSSSMKYRLELASTCLPPGEYTVFIELTRSDWTFIVSTLQAQTQGFDENDSDSVFRCVRLHAQQGPRPSADADRDPAVLARPAPLGISRHHADGR